MRQKFILFPCADIEGADLNVRKKGSICKNTQVGIDLSNINIGVSGSAKRILICTN